MSALRMSTAALYQQGLQGLMQQQQRIARAQQELVSQSKLLRGADNPSGMARAQQMDHALSSLQQQDRNATLVEHRLRTQEGALADVGQQLDRARVLTVQANSPALSDRDRASIAAELRAVRSELLAIANRDRSEEHTSELQSRENIVCRLLLEKKKIE